MSTSEEKEPLNEKTLLLSDEAINHLKEWAIEREKKASKKMHSLYEELLACSTEFLKTALPLLLEMTKTRTLAEPWSKPQSYPSAERQIAREEFSQTHPPQDQKG